MGVFLNSYDHLPSSRKFWKFLSFWTFWTFWKFRILLVSVLGSRQMLPVAKLFIQSRWLDTLVKSSMIIWWYDMIWYDTWHILQAENRDWMANYIHYLYSTIAGSPQWGWHGRSCHKRPWGRQGSRLWNSSDTWRGRCRWCWRSLCQDSSTCTFCIYRLSLRSL